MPPSRVNAFVENKGVGNDINFQLEPKSRSVQACSGRAKALKTKGRRCGTCLPYPPQRVASLRYGAAVHDDYLAVHEAVTVADEEGGDLGQLGGAPHAAGRGPEL